MTHNIDAIYSDGVFRPIGPFVLPDGARVHLRVESEDDTTSIGPPNGMSNYEAWLDRVAGRWLGDDFVRGDEGDCETREPFS